LMTLCPSIRSSAISQVCRITVRQIVQIKCAFLEIIKKNAAIWP